MSDDLSEQKVKEAFEALDAMFVAIPKSKRMEFIGQFNAVSLFIEHATRYIRDHEPEKGK